ncbi:MAG: HigA family addiction module antidote protein [Phycisphaerales bacterium]|nr:HigA family addiction module antidote protein [Phycisphaerales bacterium]
MMAIEPNMRAGPADAFAPGEFIRDELEARGWEQRDLADIMGRPERTVSELIAGKRAITPETAQQLGEAFGTTAQFWMNMESAYRLHRLGKPNETVARRARLYSIAPVKEMIRRGWIMESASVDVLEEQIKQFFRVPSLEEAPSVCAAAARKATGNDTHYSEFTPAQRAWLCRSRQLAETLKVAKFDLAKFRAHLPAVKNLLTNAEDVRQVPKLMAEFGVRCVVVEHLPQTRIDGACFWLDSKSPVVALSLRFDRIDWFWFTLMHELGHIDAGDGRYDPIPPDIDLVGVDSSQTPDKPAFEKAADSFASSFLIPDAQLSSFIARVRPLYSKKKIEGFAAVQQVHPGLVVGQLQYRKEISYANLRAYLVKVRAHLLETVLSDGWGVTPPTGK